MKKKLFVALLSMAALFSISAAQAEVARSIITTGVVDREPTSELERIEPGTERVIYFTELRDMSDKSVSHVWKYDGEVVAEVKFDVGGPRWRVWSSKNLMPEWAGEWSVSVVDSWGNVLAEKSFTYLAADTDGMMEMQGEGGAEMTGEEPMMEPAADEMDAEAAMEPAADKVDGEAAMEAPEEGMTQGE